MVSDSIAPRNHQEVIFTLFFVTCESATVVVPSGIYDLILHSNQLLFSVYFKVGLADWQGEDGKRRLDAFLVDVINRMSDPPWNSTLAQERNLTVRTACENIYTHYKRLP